MPRSWTGWVIRFLGIVIFVIVVSRLKLRDLWEVVLSANAVLLGIAVAFQLITNVLRSERWRFILSLYQKVPFLQVLRASVYGSLYGSVTPGRIGVGFAAPFVRNAGLSY